MVAEGAKVFGIDINKEGLDLVADELGADLNPLFVISAIGSIASCSCGVRDSLWQT